MSQFIYLGFGSWVLHLLGMLGLGSICVHVTRDVSCQPSCEPWNTGMSLLTSFSKNYVIGLGSHFFLHLSCNSIELIKQSAEGNDRQKE